MRATDFEFRNRFWVIAALFFVGFSCSVLDHRNAASVLARGNATGVHLVLGAGALLAAMAAAVRTWASAYLHTEVVKDHALHADRLVADGPYRHVRNPLYLGTLLLAVCFGLMASRLGFLVIVGGLLIFVLRLIGREEAALSHTQGRAFAAYRARVPRLWPGLSPPRPRERCAPPVAPGVHRRARDVGVRHRRGRLRGDVRSAPPLRFSGLGIPRLLPGCPRQACITNSL